MKVEELKKIFLELEKWTRKNKDKITNPIRARHFMEDMAYLIHWLDDKTVNEQIQIWRNESISAYIIKLFGIK